MCRGEDPLNTSIGLKNNRFTILFEVGVTLLCAVLSAFAMWVFVFPANFAPSGVDGIATMLQELTKINAGYFSFLFNAPLLLTAWFKLDKKYVLYTLLYIAVSSVLLVVLEQVRFYQYVTETELWIPMVVSGVMMGVRTGMMIRMGASAGGADIIGGLIQKARPYIDVERPISIMCYATIVMSYFVYGNLKSVLIALMQTFIMTVVMGRVLHSSRSAVEAKIITDDPDAFKEEIVTKLKHGATIIKGEGMFTGDGKSIIIAVINIRQMKELMDITRRHPNSFVYFGDATGVWGNFRWRASDEAK